MNNILFYSDKCQFSNTFIAKLQDEINVAKQDKDSDRVKLLSNIKLVNILTLKNIPDNITTIPTIIVHNITVPLSGLDAFAWLENTKYFYQKTNNIKQNVRQITINNSDNGDTNASNINRNKNKNSDEFANLKDEDDDKITNTKFNGAKQNILITEGNTKNLAKDDKVKPEVQNSKMNELIAQRKYQMQQFINSNKKR